MLPLGGLGDSNSTSYVYISARAISLIPSVLFFIYYCQNHPCFYLLFFTFFFICIRSLRISYNVWLCVPPMPKSSQMFKIVSRFLWSYWNKCSDATDSRTLRTLTNDFRSWVQKLHYKHISPSDTRTVASVEWFLSCLTSYQHTYSKTANLLVSGVWFLWNKVLLLRNSERAGIVQTAGTAGS